MFSSFESNPYDPADERVLCRITILNGRLIKFLPDLGTFNIKTRHGNYSIRIQMNTPEIEFDSLALKFQKLEVENEASGTVDEELDKLEGFKVPENNSYLIHYMIIIGEF